MNNEEGEKQFLSTLNRYKKDFESNYLKILKRTSLAEADVGLQKALIYPLKAGGKRLRPAIVFESADLIRLDTGKAQIIATAVELLHTYSLVHDDLPAMDNDDLRRGKPTTHKVFGEDTAILVGDGLQSLSFELLAQANLSAEGILFFARCIGPGGLVNGQFVDMQNHKVKSVSSLEKLHINKTGKLFAASVLLPFLFRKSLKELEPVVQWSLKLGLLFQIIDDIIDATKSTSELGKTSGKDQKLDKKTFLTFLGMEKAGKVAQKLSKELSFTAAQLFNNSEFYEYIPVHFYNRLI